MTVAEATTTNSKLITVKQIVEVTERGGTVRRGSYLASGWNPTWEWQLFDSAGQFIGRVTHKRLTQWVLEHDGAVECRQPGINR